MKQDGLAWMAKQEGRAPHGARGLKQTGERTTVERLVAPRTGRVD